MKKHDLERRLIEFSVDIIKLSRKLDNSYAGKHLSYQLIRSGTSVSLNYGEALSGESKRDFIHKLKIILKELRETYICLTIIKETFLCRDCKLLEEVKIEANELICIFVTTINTTFKNLNLKNKSL